MKLGLAIGYWSAGPPFGVEAQIAVAERLGFDSMWSAEAYGSDAFTPLAWWGASTERIRLGTGIVQMSARTPAATAMAAMTLDHLSGGRVILGLGVSGPQVVEGWYGRPYSRPLARTREYVEIVRRIVARRSPVEFEGEFYQLPLDGGTGLGKPLKSTLHPYRTDLPIFLAAEGPRNVALSAEIGDGWLPLFFAPKDDAFYRAALQEGFDRGGRRSWDDFEIPAIVPVVPNPDIEAAADMIRPMLALYIGGMGARDRNFHKDVFVRMGFEAECEAIQDHYLEGRKADAVAAVPTEMVEAMSLIGSPDKIRDELARWEESVVTTLLIQGPPDLLEMMAEIV
jgi:F420-dependent oxidoreductase-like protein